MLRRGVAMMKKAAPLLGSFVGKANASRGSNGNVTIDGTGIGIQNGDYMLTLIAGRNAVDPATLSGWSLIGSRDTSDQPSQFLYAREASGESGSYTWTLGDGGTGLLMVYRDVELDLVGTWARVSGSQVTLGGVTATAAGILVAFYSIDNNGSTWTAPAGMTEREDVQGANNEAQTVGAADLIPSAAGATGDKSPTCSSTANAIAGVLVALKNK